MYVIPLRCPASSTLACTAPLELCVQCARHARRVPHVRWTRCGPDYCHCHHLSGVMNMESYHIKMAKQMWWTLPAGYDVLMSCSCFRISANKNWGGKLSWASFQDQSGVDKSSFGDLVGSWAVTMSVYIFCVYSVLVFINYISVLAFIMYIYIILYIYNYIYHINSYHMRTSDLWVHAPKS